MATATQQKPVHTTRSGQFEAACWSNSGKEDSTYYTVTFKKSWNDDGEWKDRSIRFHQNQTLGVAQLLRWADSTVQRAYERSPSTEDGKPIASLKRSSDRVEAGVWKNVTENGDSYSVTLTRSFKKDGTWTNERISLFANECLTAAHVLTRAFDGIDEFKRSKSSQFVEAAKRTFGEGVADSDADIPF